MISLFRHLLLLLAFAQASAPVRFVDITTKANLKDIIVSGGLKKRFVLEVNGSGSCWLDYDADGRMDLYLVNGATLEQLQGKQPPSTTNHLYRNNPDGSFTDVTQIAGVPGKGWGFGCVAADYDNDGHTDLFVSNFGHNLLYRNRGDGSFTDSTAKAGLAGDPIWHAGATFGDYNLDGHLDLFVPGYLDFNIARPELRSCEYRGLKVNACGPLGYAGAPDSLYRNNGDGTFSNVTTSAGVADKKLLFGFQAVFEDFDNDGWPDLFVANDSHPNLLYKNNRDGTFTELGVPAGVAYNADGKEMSSMGVAVGDYNHDGNTDLFITTFANDNYVLLQNEGAGLFTDVSFPAGVGEPTIPYLGWASFFLDYDNDGFLDLLCANGHVYPEVDGVLRESYRQPLQLFQNLRNGRFRDVSRDTGLTAFAKQSARGGSFADIDNDGDLDFVVSNIDSLPTLAENRGGNQQNWLRIVLQGQTCNRMAVGAKVKVTTPNTVSYNRLRAGESYLSSADPRLHFGLGKESTVTVEVQWPGGKTEVIPNLPANQTVFIRQGQGKVATGIKKIP
ncbi:MAG: CRTAC1 family protein [Acidobacteriota bacterium]